MEQHFPIPRLQCLDLWLGCGDSRQLSGETYLGLAAYRINQPNPSLASSDSGQIPLESGWVVPTLSLTGCSQPWISITLTPISVLPTNSRCMAPRSLVLDHSIAFRTGANPDELPWGSLSQSLVSGLSDRLCIRLSPDHIYKTGISNHLISATFRFAKPKPAYDFAMLSVTATSAITPKTNRYESPSVMKNYSDLPSTGISVSCYAADSFGHNILIDRRRLSVWSPGQEETLRWEWHPDKEDRYQIYTAVDDDGTALPKLKGQVEEIDETNISFIQRSEPIPCRIVLLFLNTRSCGSPSAMCTRKKNAYSHRLLWDQLLHL